MKSKRRISFTITITCLIVSIIALANTDIKRVIKVAKFTSLSAPQNVEREIEKERPHPKDPVELTEIKIQGKTVQLKEKFLEDGEWLKKSAFKLKNKYSKTISYIQVNIDFPETETSGVMLQQQIFLGRHPVYGKPTQPQPLSLKPNESLDVSLAPEFEAIKKMIERRHAPIGFINKIMIRIRDIGFEDGTIYTAGAFFKKNPDPNSLNKWIQIQE